MQRIGWICAILLLLGIGLGLWWVHRRGPDLSGAIPKGQPGMMMMGTSLVGRENGERAWEVRAKTIWLSKDNRIAVIRDIEEAIIEVEGERVVFKAAWARLDRNMMKMTVRGGITGRIDDGEFQTEGIFVDLLKQRLTSTGQVLFQSNNTHISARRLEADLKADIVTLKEDVLLREGSKVLRGQKLIYCLKEKTYEVIGETEVEFEL